MGEGGGREEEWGMKGGWRGGWFERKWGSKRWGGEMRGAGGGGDDQGALRGLGP